MIIRRDDQLLEAQGPFSAVFYNQYWIYYSTNIKYIVRSRLLHMKRLVNLMKNEAQI